MDYLFRGGVIVTDGLEIQADLGITGEKISHWGQALEPGPGTEVIEAEGNYLFPGGVELLMDPEIPRGADGAEFFQRWSGMALMGGLTSAVIPCSPSAGVPLGPWLASRRKAYEGGVGGGGFMDFGFHLAIGECTPETRKWIREAPALGMSSVWMLLPENMDIGANGAAGFGAKLVAARGEIPDDMLMITCFWDDWMSPSCASEAENGAAPPTPAAPKFDGTLEIPAWIEKETIERLGRLAAASGRGVMLRSIGSRGAFDSLKEARESGAKLWAAAPAAHLLAHFNTHPDAEPAKRPMFAWPPLRTKHDQAILWHGLEEGLIPILTAHRGIPARCRTPQESGYPILENTLALWYPLLYTEGAAKNRISLPSLIQAMTSEPAKLAGLYPAKGSLLIGADADVVVFNPRVSWSVGGAAAEGEGEGESGPEAPPLEGPFAGWALQGAVEQVFLRGKRAASYGEMKIEAGGGKFLERKMQM